MSTRQDDGDRISFSELKIWNECSYKHKLIYKDNLPHFKGNEYTAFGTAMHLMCERNIMNSDIDTLQVFEKAFAEELSSLKNDGAILDDNLITAMRSQAGPLCEQAIPALKKYFGEYEVISVEEKLLEQIEEFDASGKKFKGYIDVVLKTSDGKYHIIDWKTCSWGWNLDRRTDPMTTYQLTYYKNYFCKKHNIDPKTVETYFGLLKRTATKNNIEIFRVTSGPKKTSNSLNLLRKAVININKDNYIKNRLACRNCAFYKTSHCR